MAGRRWTLIAICVIGWSLLSLQVLMGFAMAYFDSVAIWDPSWPWMSWPIVSDLLPISFVTGFVTVFYSTYYLTIGLFATWTASRTPGDPEWRIQIPHCLNSIEARP